MEKTKMYIQNNAGQVILGLALILAVIVGGIFYMNKSATGNTLTVTGSARMSATADNVIWRSSISRTVLGSDLKSGYAGIASDLKLVQAYMKQKGIKDEEIIVSPVTVYEEYSNDSGAPKRYNLRQNIEVNSSNVQGITDIAKSVDQLVAQGAFYQTDSVEYYYSKLNEARVSLLTDAITDARARADAMAKSTHQHVGKLSSASSGVVQVLSKGAVDNGEYGQYDTSKIDKEISVTVRATFNLR